MVTPADNNQSGKEDFDLLAMFDPVSSQDLGTYTDAHTPLAVSASRTASDSVNPTEDTRITVDNWTVNLDEDTLSYLDEIIALDQAHKKADTCAKPVASSEIDPTFSIPRKFKCPMCPKEFNSNAAMRYHGRRHILKLIKCPCGFKGQSLVQQQKHYAYHHVGVSKHKFLASF